jgi:hypothetical protein
MSNPTPTQLPPQISDLRDQYLRAYRQYLADNRPKLPDLTPELLALVGTAEDVPEHHRLLRPDAVWRGDDGKPAFARIEPPPLPTFPPIHLTAANNTQITVHPFPWDDCALSFSHPAFPWPKLADWITLHIDRHGQFPPDDAGLHGVIHSCSAPESRGSRHYLYLDFGSAPASAVVELIDLLATHGATRVTIGAPAAT